MPETMRWPCLPPNACFPGPVILLVAKPRFISDELAAGLQTLGFRVPDDPFARAILERCGPFAGTTANPATLRDIGGDDDRSMLPPADLLVEHGPTALRARIVDRRPLRAARAPAARGRDPGRPAGGTLGADRTSYDKGALARS